ncbi:MAG: CDP-archaeol synthase [Anaerolineae bacterium]|nr:CDP-archaeol synthase [Anaerolineae bacterium]
MLRTRVLTAAVLIPVAIGLIYLGGLPFLALIGLMLSLAEVEFCRLMAQDSFHPTLAFGLGLVWLLLLDAQIPELGLLEPGLALILLASLTWQMCHRQGSPVADWALTIIGGLYLGGCGASMVRLRGLCDGRWWMLIVLSTVICADSAAYFVGRAWGRHRMTPSLSPGKTWEGYISGLVVGGLIPMFLILLWRVTASIETSIVHGLILGLLIGSLSPLGDLAISMIKRQVGAKDSGKIIPGHGGALDRLDSLLWAGVISYYYISGFVS